MKVNLAKKTFTFLFLLLAVMLLVLPFITTTSELFAAVFNKFGWYRFLAELIVPFETRAIAGIIGLLGYQVQAAPKTVSIFRNGVWETVGISWNCIGWQSLILMMVTLFIGLQGEFTRGSKLECILIGILGVVLLNFLRLAVITYLIFNFNQIPATILHDYLAAIVTILWLFGFWWFSYSFILEPKLRVGA